MGEAAAAAAATAQLKVTMSYLLLALTERRYCAAGALDKVMTS